MSKYIAIGAGPCADLITIRGLRALRQADVVLYDRLADSELLDGCNAEKIYVGKEPYANNAALTCPDRQAEINRLIDLHLHKGKVVARLKGGDSVIFSRVMEELGIATKAGAEIEIIPGVTAASAAAATVECALTDRIHASGVIYITGHQKGGIPDYDWKALAANNFTIVVYMGAKYISYIVGHLLSNGMDKATPVLAASNVGQKKQHMRVFKADEVAEYAKDDSVTVFIIGGVLSAYNIKAEALMSGAQHE